MEDHTWEYVDDYFADSVDYNDTMREDYDDEYYEEEDHHNEWKNYYNEISNEIEY